MLISLKNIRPKIVGELVRLGRNNDGGYIVPKLALDRCHVLFSIGINDDWSFEEDFVLHVPHVKVVGIDGTAGVALLLRQSIIKLIQSIGSIAILNFKKAQERLCYPIKIFRFVRFFKSQIFIKKMLSTSDKKDCISLAFLFETYAGQNSPDNYIFLKLDIEGGEYDVLLESGDLLIKHFKVGCIVLEFHALGNNWGKFEKIVNFLQTHFVVVHVHANNCSPLISGTNVPEVIEITWLNIKFTSADTEFSQLSYPIQGLDQPCSSRLPDHLLNFT
jgi:hypothetical protein